MVHDLYVQKFVDDLPEGTMRRPPTVSDAPDKPLLIDIVDTFSLFKHAQEGVRDYRPRGDLPAPSKSAIENALVFPRKTLEALEKNLVNLNKRPITNHYTEEDKKGYINATTKEISKQKEKIADLTHLSHVIIDNKSMSRNVKIALDNSSVNSHYIIEFQIENSSLEFDQVSAEVGRFVLNYLDSIMTDFRFSLVEISNPGQALDEPKFITMEGAEKGEYVFGNMRFISLIDVLSDREIAGPIYQSRKSLSDGYTSDLGFVEVLLPQADRNGVASPWATILIAKKFPVLLMNDAEGLQKYSFVENRATPLQIDASDPKPGPGQVLAYSCRLKWADAPPGGGAVPAVLNAVMEPNVIARGRGYGGGGGGGGAMRSDKADEVAYRLTMGAPPLPSIDAAVAGPEYLPGLTGEQLARLAGLDLKKTVSSPADSINLNYHSEYIADKLTKKKNNPKGPPAPPPFNFRVPTSGQSTKASLLSEINLLVAQINKSDPGLALTIEKKKKKGDAAAGVGLGTGEALKRSNPNDRIAASSVMKDGLASYMAGADPAWRGEATPFAAKAVKAITPKFAPNAAWKTFTERLRWSGTMRTDQEWCHLHGHGLGGSEQPDNFVSGSEHCNTEQLAIELGQKDAGIDGLKARVTAYLLPAFKSEKAVFAPGDVATFNALSSRNPPVIAPPPDPLKLAANDKGEQSRLTKAVTDVIALSDDLLAQKFGYVAAATPAGAKTLASQIQRMREKLKNTIYTELPVGMMIRYKIFDKVGKKIFDYTFSAQSEGFDINQYNLLYWLVRTAVVRGAGGTADEVAKRNKALDLAVAAKIMAKEKAAAAKAAKEKARADASSDPAQPDHPMQ
jgi:hypothetical protein